MSYSWLNNMNKISSWPLKWVLGQFQTHKTEPFFSQMSYNCPKCSMHHPLDPLSILAFCPSAKSCRALFLEAWPMPFFQTVILWFTNASYRDRRNFFRTLIPISLSEKLLTPQNPNQNPHEHKTLLFNTFKQRNMSTTAAIKTTKTFFQIENYSPTPSHNPPIKIHNIFKISTPTKATKRPSHFAFESLPSKVQKKQTKMKPKTSLPKRKISFFH